MKFILAAILCICSLAAAAVPQARPDLSRLKEMDYPLEPNRRQEATVFFCDKVWNAHVNYKGYCRALVKPFGFCVTLEDDLDNVVSGIVMVDPEVVCKFYAEPDCKPEDRRSKSPSWFERSSPANMNIKQWEKMDNRISSYICDRQV